MVSLWESSVFSVETGSIAVISHNSEVNQQVLGIIRDHGETSGHLIPELGIKCPLVYLQE